MMNARTLAICAFGIALMGHRLEGQDLSRYRTFELRNDLASVSTLTGVATSEARMIHERPAVLQDLEWRPSRWIPGSTAFSTDPVEHIFFSFYNNQLFRIVVDYGRERTAGMTDADLTEALSAAYGTPLPRTSRATVPGASRLETESGSPVARWGDTEHAVVLYRSSSFRETFRLIVTDAALDDLARKAEAEARRLDELEAPRREIARQKKEQDDGRAAAEKARVVNKKTFLP